MIGKGVARWLDSPWIILVGMLLGGLLAYGQTAFYPFVHDDVVFIRDNPRLADISLLKALKLTVDFQLRTKEGVNTYYRPLLEWLYGWQFRLFGLNPAGYHLFNIVLHSVNGFLVFLVTRRLSGPTGVSRWWPLGVALFYLWHPVQSEAVACIAGISNLFFAFWGWLGFYSYIRSWKGVSWIACALALLSKEQAVVLPVLFAWYDLFWRRDGVRGTLGRWLPFAFLLAGYFLLRTCVIRGGDAVPALGNPYELWLRVLAIPRTLLMYGRLIVFPYDLHYYRSTDILRPFWPGMVGLAVLVGGLVWWARRASRKKAAWLIFGLGWFILALGPLLNILPLINEYSLILTAEHFLYLPLWGFLTAASALLAGKVRREIWIAALGICLVLTTRQVTYWRGEVPLFERVVRYEPSFGRAHILLGKAYMKEGRYARALAAQQKAAAIMRGYIAKVADGPVKEFYRGYLRDIEADQEWIRRRVAGERMEKRRKERR